jgi:DNA-binding transcriptional LysR family regulator
MDINLARTFLEIVESGSFVAAAERLNLTQTAISARVRALESQLERRLFVRNKAGARLTPAGERFVRHAATLVRVWEQARQQVALPAGRETLFRLGGELSIWHPLLSDWLSWMRREHAEVALRTEVDVPERLLDRVQAGTLDLAVVYGPQPRSGLVIELLAEEKLIMVTTRRDGSWKVDDYVHVDWGSAFQASHREAFPALLNPPISISLGPLALEHIQASGGAGYFRTRAVRKLIEKGRLRRVKDAPEFSHSISLVYSGRHDRDLIDQVRGGLRTVASHSSA